MTYTLKTPRTGNITLGHITPCGLMIRTPSGTNTIVRARRIFRTLGAYRAARFLRSRGWSVEATLYILFNK